jgi:hypothetical protein
MNRVDHVTVDPGSNGTIVAAITSVSSALDDKTLVGTKDVGGQKHLALPEELVLQKVFIREIRTRQPLVPAFEG